ncbi:MAG: hypothetical protein D6720_05635 [Gammaproteobacteria bacterium]|nr:MAG: hypothetical protein D6720_05635 [Gammaproteobacteria bacterium]
MKILLTTAILAFSFTSAHAWEPRFDNQEYYSGLSDSQLLTRSETQSPDLYREGNYADINQRSGMDEGDTIGHVDNPDSLVYEEAAYDV